MVKAFRGAWERFLALPPALRRVIYTTNSIESLNYQLRKVSKNRGHFPNDAAVVKLLWLVIAYPDRRHVLAHPQQPEELRLLRARVHPRRRTPHRCRRHSFLGNVSPVEFEKRQSKLTAA